MSQTLLFSLTAMFFLLAFGGVAFAFSGGGGRAQKRVAAVGRRNVKGPLVRNAADANQQKRKNVTALLKDLEKQQAEHKKRPNLRRRIEQAGLTITVRTYWILSGVLAFVVFAGLYITHQPLVVFLSMPFTAGYVLPRFVLSFLKKRREKLFTENFAGAIDAIVRSIKSGLPTNEALKLIAREMPQPVSGEFALLVESVKVGVSMDQALKRMYERMPTPEVAFFGIVMTVQQKSGGNLSEALGNLAGVLRDRKRLEGKIKAMSSEAKASAAIIGSLPPAVGTLVWLSTPAYIETLFTTHTGNLMIAGCAVWMACGIFVMKKMINFKH